jgi:hypothetical protein
MALIDKLTAIADAIRTKTGSTEPMTLDEMAEIISTLGVGGSTTSVFAPLYEKFTIDKSEYPIVGISFQSDYVSMGFAKEIVGNTDGSYTLKYGYLQSTYDASLGVETLEDAIAVCMTFTSVNDKNTSTNMMTLRSDRTVYCNAPIVQGSFVNYIE